MTRLALTLVSGIILVVAAWARTEENASVSGNRAGAVRAYHEGVRVLDDPLSAQSAQDPLQRRESRFMAIGSESCRACHRAIFESWASSPHSSSDSALLEENRVDPECLPCHAPLYDFDHPVLSTEVGIACEACHGPGSAYSSLAVMIDPLKRRNAGLLAGPQGCQDCHNPGHADHVERDLDGESRRVHPAPPIRTTQR